MAALIWLGLLWHGSPAGAVGKSLMEDFEKGRIQTVVAFGDSVVQGYGLAEGWPEILGRRLTSRFRKVRLVNAGRAGDTVADGLGRLAEVLSLRPQLVLVAFGLNDMKKQVDPAVFNQELEAMVDRLRGAGARVVLLTTTHLLIGAGPMLGLDPQPYNEVTRALARRRGLPLVDIYRDGRKLNRRRYLLDMVHPNAEGHARLAEIIEKGLLP